MAMKSIKKSFVVYEINTRVWLRTLRQKGRPNLTLATIPDSEFQKWRQYRYTHIWLMGVWTPSQKGRQIALENQALRHEFDKALPDWTEEDIASSPYSIPKYEVSEELGGESAMAKFRLKLADAGIALILDFVSNHLSLDSPLVRHHPQYFVELSPAAAGNYPFEYYQTPNDKTFFACGKSPESAAWIDSLQLNYAHAPLRKYMIEMLVSIAERCDGVRCDVAMLQLKAIFNQTWGHLAGNMEKEFWQEAISTVKSKHQNFLFIAEAYWDKEWTLQQQGFDFTYDKRLYDRLRTGNASLIRDHLNAPMVYQQKMVRFTENHDEQGSAAIFGYNVRAALMCIMMLPGMKLIRQGELEGSTVKLPLQLLRFPYEKPDEKLVRFYHELSQILAHPALQQGEFHLLVLEGDDAQSILGFERVYGKNLSQVYVLLNFTDKMKEIYFRTDAFKAIESYEHLEVLTTHPLFSPQFELWQGGITVRLRPHEGLTIVVS
jgi:glycosidase